MSSSPRGGPCFPPAFNGMVTSGKVDRSEPTKLATTKTTGRPPPTAKRATQGGNFNLLGDSYCSAHADGLTIPVAHPF
jgi:hypothetical protein